MDGGVVGLGVGEGVVGWFGRLGFGVDSLGDSVGLLDFGDGGSLFDFGFGSGVLGSGGGQMVGSLVVAPVSPFVLMFPVFFCFFSPFFPLSPFFSFAF